MADGSERAGPDEELIRELGAIERLFFTMDQNRPVQFVLAAAVSGQIEAAALRMALRAVQARHPLLSCRIEVGQDGRLAFYRSPAAEITVRLAGRGDPSAWTREAERELAMPFDTTRAPLLRTALIEGDGEAVLLIAAHHAIADGRSILFVIRDLLAALSGELLAPLDPLPSREDLIARLPQDGQRASERPSAAAPNAPNTYVVKGSAPHVADLRLGAALTAALQDRAKRETTTVHGALCAALARAVYDGSQGWRGSLCIGSPIDIRGRLGVGENCMFLLGSGRAICGPDLPSDFWDLARAMRNEIAEGGTPEQIYAGASRLNGLFSTNPDASTVATVGAAGFGQAVMTNLGLVPFGDHFGDLRLKEIYGPALLMGFDRVPTIGAVTTGGRLHLTLSTFTPRPDLLLAMEREMQAALS